MKRRQSCGVNKPMLIRLNRHNFNNQLLCYETMDNVWPFRHLKGQFDLSNWLITAGHVALRIETRTILLFIIHRNL